MMGRKKIIDKVTKPIAGTKDATRKLLPIFCSAFWRFSIDLISSSKIF
jgi:hypothetical protein